MTPATYAFDALGTRWEIETDVEIAARLRAAVRDRIEAFDRAYSRFRPDSLVTSLARAEGGAEVDFPDDAVELFALYDRLHTVTEGAVDPLVGRDLELLGYDARYSMVPTPDPRTPAERPCWGSDVRRDGRAIATTRPVVIDVGAVGKGYLVDQVAALLTAAGVAQTVVDGSGDLRVTGDQTVRIGLEHPERAGQAIGVAELRDQALCASAVTRRRWGPGLHHVIDARDGRPTERVLATWVVAGTAAVADGLATALFFTEPATLAAAFEFAFVRVLADGGAEWSVDFPGELFV